MDADTLVKRYEAALQERRRLEPMFDDAIRLTMPGRRRFHEVNPTDSADDIFDETGANAVAEFVSRMQAGMFPPFSKFIALEPSSAVEPKDRAALQRDLDDIVDYAFEQIWRSNFAQESAESLNDFAITSGTLVVEEGDAETPLIHRAVPITELALDRGPNDMIGTQYRHAQVKAGELELRYGTRLNMDNAPSAARIMAEERDRPLEVVECTYRDYNQPGIVNRHMVIVRDTREVIVSRTMKGLGSNPMITYRWSTAAGETWGRGPLLSALAAIRTTNLMVELVLENAAMAIVGMYQTDNEGTVNADNINLVPGAILNKEFGTTGLEPIQGPTGSFNMQDVVLNDQRLNIRRALFNDMLADPNKTPATATEVAERMADLAHRTSAGFARVFHEMIVPYFRRVLYILEKRGDIELPKQSGEVLQFTSVAPLAQVQRARDVQKLAQDYQIRSMIYGPQLAAQSYDLRTMHTWMQQQIGLPSNLYKTFDDFQKTLQQQADQLQQAQQAMQGQVIELPANSGRGGR